MNCSKEQEAGGLGEPGAWELLGGSRNVFSRVQSTSCGTWELSNSLEISLGRAPIVVFSASSWQFPSPGVVLAWNCLSSGQALPCTWCHVCLCHADGKQLRSLLLCYLGLGLVCFENLGILEINTRSESKIVSVFKKQNKILLKRGGQDLPSV